jgi:hypothetical protein
MTARYFYLDGRPAPEPTDRFAFLPVPRRPGTIGTSDRFKDVAGRVWKLTKKGWRLWTPGKAVGR